MASNTSDTVMSVCKAKNARLSNQSKYSNDSSLLSFLSKRNSNLLRTSVLFLLGSSLCLVLNILQMEYKSNLFPSEVVLFLKTLWWVMTMGGCAAVYIGFSYPFFDHKFGQCHRNDRESSHIIRSFTMFIGLNHLCVKIQFANTSHFLMILILFCLLFWYWFDKTKFGLIFNTINAVTVILVAHFLRYIGLFK